jgi:hypothetical protein
MINIVSFATARIAELLRKASVDATAQRRRNQYKDKFWTTVELLEDRTLLSGTAPCAPPVEPAGPVTPPTLTVVSPAAGQANEAVSLSVSASLSTPEGEQVLSLTISGVPFGATISDGQSWITGDGESTYCITGWNLGTLSITPAYNDGLDFTLTFTATATSTNTLDGEDPESASTSELLDVTVNDAPLLLTLQDDLSVEEGGTVGIGQSALEYTDAEQLPEEVVYTIVSGTQNGVLRRNLGNGEYEILTAESTFTQADINVDAISYVHDGGETTDDSFSYTVSDGQVVLDESIFAISVTSVNDAPELTGSLVGTVHEGGLPLVITNEMLQATDREQSADEIFYRLNATPAHGTLRVSLGNGDYQDLGIGDHFTQAQIDLGLVEYLNDGEEFDADSFDFTATDGFAATDLTFQITINAVADAPTLVVAPARTTEDTPVPLEVLATLGSENGDELLSIEIQNIPPGVTLTDGSGNTFTASENGSSIEISAWDLSSLTLTPVADSDADYTLRVVAVASESNASTATASADLEVTVDAVADEVTLEVADAEGAEDTVIPLSIAATFGDLIDGSETHSLTISGVPTGAVISDGNQSWTASDAESTVDVLGWDLENLTITPPADSDIDFELTVTALATETATTNGETNVSSIERSISVTVHAVADSPTLTVSAAFGDEDTPIPLDITATVTDLDSESIASLVIGNIPVGATISDGNPDHTFTASEGCQSYDVAGWTLDSLTITPLLHSDGDFTLTVTATSAEARPDDGSETSTVEATLDVVVTAVADAPTLTVTTPARGQEDTAIPLVISVVFDDTDGSETQTLTIAGVPAGSTLSDGSGNLVVVVDSDQVIALTGWNLQGLTVTPPTNRDGDFTLTVVAQSSEANDPSVETVTLTIDVEVEAVADAPELSTAAVTGLEDATIPLTVVTSLTDVDGTESLQIVVSGIPAGATISDGNPEHTFTATANAGSFDITSWDLSGLRVAPLADSGDDFTLTFTSTSTEANGGDTAETVRTLRVTVTAVADAPELTVTAASGDEDTAIPLDISTSLTDTDESESLRLFVGSIPVGATITDGNPAHRFTASEGMTQWEVTGWDLDQLTIQLRTHSSDDFTLTVTSLTTEGENGSTASTVRSLPVTVVAVADVPVLTATDTAGNEDTVIPLTVTNSLVDLDGSETRTLVISGIPVGATIADGAGHTFTATANNTSYDITAWNLGGLRVTPPLHSGDDFTLTLTTTATEGENGDFETVVQTLAVSVVAVADAPTLTLTSAIGDEDTTIPLTITNSLVDQDGSETIRLVVSNIPVGATITDGNPEHTFTATAGNTSVDITSWTLSGLRVTPLLNSGDDFTVTFTSTTTEGENQSTAQTVRYLTVTITAVADAPILTVSPATGREDTAIPLSVTNTLFDEDGSETRTLILSGIPAGSVVTDGTNTFTATANARSVNITSWSLASLRVTPPLNDNRDFVLTLTSTSAEGENTSTAVTIRTLLVTVLPVNDQPDVAPTDRPTIDQAQSFVVDLRPYLTDVETNPDDFTFEITGVTGGYATISDDGNYAIFIPDPDFVGIATFTYSATDRGDRLEEDPDDVPRQEITRSGTISVRVLRYQDLGDAPESYGTTAPDQNNPGPNGARHGGSHINENPIRLGSTVGYGETNGQPTPGADGDDVNGGDDEDGVTILTGLEGRDDRDLIRTLRIEAPAGGRLDAWIDFDRDGTFDENERVEFRNNRRAVRGEDGTVGTESTFELDGTSLVLHEGVNYVDVVIPADAVDFTDTIVGEDGRSQEVSRDVVSTYARFRVSTQGHLNANGFAVDGEVEDYLVTIGNRNPQPGYADSRTFEAALEIATERFIAAYADELIADPNYQPDGSVPLTFQGAGSGEDEQFEQGETDAELQEIIAAINYQMSLDRGVTENVFVFVTHPVDYVITDPNGRQAGHTAERGTFNEIGGNVTFSGDGAVELLVIRNASPGEYQIDFTGVGGVFRGGASLITANGTQQSTFQGGLTVSQAVSLSLDYAAPVLGTEGSQVAQLGGRGQVFFNVADGNGTGDDDDALAALSGLDAENESGELTPREQIIRWIDAVRTNSKALKRVMLDELEPDWLTEDSLETQNLLDEFWTGLGQSMLGGIPGQVFQLGEFLGVEVPLLFAPAEPDGVPQEVRSSGEATETQETSSVEGRRTTIATSTGVAGEGSVAGSGEADGAGVIAVADATGDESGIALRGVFDGSPDSRRLAVDAIRSMARGRRSLSGK